MVEYKASYGPFTEWYHSLSRDDWNAYQLSRCPDVCICDSCYWFEMKGRRMYIMSDLPPMAKESLYKKIVKQWTEGCISMPKRPRKSGNGKPKGLFVGTLTMSPTDPYNEDDMIKAVRKLFSQTTSPVKKYSWYLEYTKNELPHIHFCYETVSGGRILPKVFRRVWPIWNESPDAPKLGQGHPGGYHAPCVDPEAYLKYISKDEGRHETRGFQRPSVQNSFSIKSPGLV